MDEGKGFSGSGGGLGNDPGHLASKAFFTDGIRRSRGVDDNAFHQRLGVHALDVIMVGMCTAPVPESVVKGTCADKACKVCHGIGDAIQDCVVGVLDSCSEEALVVEEEGHLGVSDGDLEALVPSEVEIHTEEALSLSGLVGEVGSAR